MNRLEICKRSLGTFSRCNKTKNSCHFVFYAAIIFSKKEKVFLLVGLYLEHLGMKNYQVFLTLFVTVFPASIYLFRVNNRNNRRRCKICSKLTIKTLERREWHHCGIFIVNFEHISHHFVPLLFLLLPSILVSILL